MKRFVRVLVLLLVLAAVAWVGPRFLQPPAIEVVHPTRGMAVQAVYATGTVEASVMMPIAARVSARLVELNVDEAAKVKKDDVLARLEDDDLQHSIEAARARAKLAREEYDRKATLLKQGFATRQAFDQSKSELQAAQAGLSKAEDEARYLKLVAPADGVIIKRDGEIGQMITAGTEVFWLSVEAPLRISAEVDEEDIAQVKAGQKVLIRADAFPGQVFHGQVQAITPKGDPIARSYRVRVALDAQTPLQIGMTAETNIIIAERSDALLLPSSAVLQDKIWRVENQKLTQQKVEIGVRGPEKTEVLDGLSDGDLVVLKPTSELRAGAAPRTLLVSPPTP